MHVPCFLREIRGKRTINEIEAASGVNRGTLSLLERGRLLPLEKHVDALERAYGRPWHEWYPPFIVAVISREVANEAA